MPLNLVKKGQINIIKKITGKDETKQFLTSLGFVEGASVSVISSLAGNLILSIKNTRVALDENLARRIIV